MTSLTNLTFKSSLILITALSLSIALTPPNGPPKSLPPRPPLTRKTIFTTQMREWFLTLYAINLLPIMLKLYWLASFNEVVHIFLTNSDHLDPLLIIGTIIAVSGTTFRYLSFRYLGEAFTFEFVPVGQRAKDPKASAKLITHGTYAIIRHPAYTGRLIAHFGYITVPFVEGTWIRNHQSWLVVKALVYTWMFIFTGSMCLVFTRTRDEDEMLKKQFGEEWERWRQRVRYRLIPYVY